MPALVPTTFLAGLLALVLCVPAQARTFLPPKGKVYAGVTAGEPERFDSQTGVHSAVFQQFVLWGNRQLNAWAWHKANANRSRLALHISTANGNSQPDVISPGAIARGDGDGYLVWLNARLREHRHPVYIRLMAEMNAHWNPYSAFNASGSSRGASYSTKAFRRAWRRTVIIVRGGPRDRVEKRLAAARLPALRAGGELARAKVSFQWVPQVAGAPDTRANRPSAYWPGRRYVDWVGTDFYSRYPNWSGLNRFYSHFRSKRRPFVFGEWAVWGADNPSFVRQLFAWSFARPDVRMLLYNQGYQTDGVFSLSRHPRSRAELSRQLKRSKVAKYAPEWR
jgi:hypothetical protein